MSILDLQPGEEPIQQAPRIQLQTGLHCIPQHYLRFRHDLITVSEVVADIDYDDRYPIFVCEDTSGSIYIQVGIIGKDNYKNQDEVKIVYGRKWRIEAELPTSEIIQTVFLALQKAREHEVREWFTLFHGHRKSTPFNNHHDLPLMAQQTQLLTNSQPLCAADDVIDETLALVRYADCYFTIKSKKQISADRLFLELEVTPEDVSTPAEIKNNVISLVLQEISASHLLYELMDALLKLSNQHVEDNFTYKGFARFSRKNDVRAIGDLSISLREKLKDGLLERSLQANNYETDMSRAPSLGSDRLSLKIKKILSEHPHLQGIHPRLRVS